MPLRSIFSFLLVAVCYLPALQGQYAGKLGINLGGAHGDFFVDVAMATRTWESPQGGTLPPTALDENGWPGQDFRTVLMDHRPVPEWGGLIDDPDRYRVDYSGVYKASFSGQASLRAAGDARIENQTYDPNTNYTTFDLIIGPTGPNHSLVILTFTNTRRDAEAGANSGITDLKVIRPGYHDRSEQLFTDDLVDALDAANFSVIRSQSFCGTTSWDITYPEEVDWLGRKPKTYAIQSSSLGDKRESAAWEYFIRLCNQTQRDIWINVPISASDDYVSGLAQLLKDSLDSHLNIYVENDNEVWNSAPAFVGTYNYNEAEAQDLGFSPEQNIARRAVELSELFADVFGAESIHQRVRVILASHAPMVKWWVQPMMNYIQSRHGAPNQYIYAISRQTYFRSATDASASVSQLLQAARNEIEQQLELDNVNQASRPDWVAFAANWNLPGGVTSYEGGPHFPSGGGLTNLSNQIQAHRDPGMKELLQYNLKEAWWDIGGGLALHFTLYSGYNRYGCWGLTDDLSNPNRNDKFAALQELVSTNIEEPVSSNQIDYRIFPNPTSSSITIKSNSSQRINIWLVDITGRVWLEGKDYHPNTELGLPDGLPAGIYFLQLQNDRGRYVLKVMFVR